MIGIHRLDRLIATCRIYVYGIIMEANVDIRLGKSSMLIEDLNRFNTEMIIKCEIFE